MADYVSSLNGSQMDAALTDMANHDSEAYAVGERNGVPVVSGDVAYHNNAKYYALIATSTVSPGDISDAVRWDTDQTSVLTALNKAQARANIAAGGSNANLLDNPWMTVNQRSIATLTNTSSFSYIVDRWKMQGSCTVFSDGLGLYQASGTQGVLRQYIEVDRLKSGEVYTLSIMLQDGTIYSATGTLTASTSTTGWQIDSTLISGRLWGGVRCYASTQVVWDIALTTSDVSGVLIRAVKLELGSVSTLANDTPPDYGTELLKCMRYFIRIIAPYYNNGFGIGRATGASTCLVFIPLPVPLRASPTVSYNAIGNLQLIGNGSNYSVSAASYSGRSEVGVNLSFTASGLSTNHLYFLTKTSQDCYIDLSADL